MKKLLTLFPVVFLLSSCSGWFFQPSGYKPPTPFLPPTRTPSIFTATPAGNGLDTATPAVIQPTSEINTPSVVITDTPVLIVTDTSSPQPTSLTPVLSVDVTVLGCNTSIDITHGMGEVTNAFVTLRNTGNVDVANLKATLFALDEGREHPDKTVEVTLLPVSQEVTIKLTVDSTYRAETPIQVEVSADGGLFERVGEASCKDIGVLAPNPASLNTPVPVNP